MGLDRWINFEQNHWISAKWGIPTELIGLVIAVGGSVYARRLFKNVSASPVK
jgi:hypothetical protein